MVKLAYLQDTDRLPAVHLKCFEGRGGKFVEAKGEKD
jgi:hypothetical protein